MTDLAALRAELPVLERKAYLNAGAQGPLPRRAVAAAHAELEAEVAEGRGTVSHFARVAGLAEGLRESVAPLLGCEPVEVALTRSTTDGINTILATLDLGPGDEVLTSDEEHPGLLAPLAAARRRRGFSIRVAPFERMVDAVEPSTTLVACSHVSWVSGRVLDGTLLSAAAEEAGARVLLDGAQGLGAVPVDVRRLGCEFYAAAGQKWLCGPDGTGYLFVRAEAAAELLSPWPSFVCLADPGRPEDLSLKPGAARFDLGIVARAQAAASQAALDALAEVGWDAVLARGPGLAARLAERLAEAGAQVVPRGRSTLVAWADEDAATTVGRLAEAGVVVRDLPGRGLVRASVGAWTSEDDLERLLEEVVAARSGR